VAIRVIPTKQCFETSQVAPDCKRGTNFGEITGWFNESNDLPHNTPCPAKVPLLKTPPGVSHFAAISCADPCGGLSSWAPLLRRHHGCSPRVVSRFIGIDPVRRLSAETCRYSHTSPAADRGSFAAEPAAGAGRFRRNEARGRDGSSAA